MITAVDTSVLLDVLAADATHGERSREALRDAFASGALSTCEVVWAEVRAHFDDDADCTEVFASLGIRFDPLSATTALLAGRLWRKYHERSRSPRTRVVADFLIGAHASVEADALLTRDRGFYRDYFRGLRVIDPSRRR
jgi:predicted nucleic acid-binding protein